MIMAENGSGFQRTEDSCKKDAFCFHVFHPSAKKTGRAGEKLLRGGADDGIIPLSGEPYGRESPHEKAVLSVYPVSVIRSGNGTRTHKRINIIKED